VSFSLFREIVQSENKRAASYVEVLSFSPASRYRPSLLDIANIYVAIEFATRISTHTGRSSNDFCQLQLRNVAGFAIIQLEVMQLLSHEVSHDNY